jgi:hypothetical protein
MKRASHRRSRRLEGFAMSTLTGLFATFAVLIASDHAERTTLKVTQRALVPVCLNGSPVPQGTRSWTVDPSPQSLVATMRNEPRPGNAGTPPGFALVTFTPEAGHVYEIEVRAEPSSFSTRVWRRGDWKPVVRDRTTDRIVSDEPRWVEGGCTP